MSNEGILLLIAGLLLIIILVYKYNPNDKCLKCSSEATEVVETFFDAISKAKAEYHYHRCGKCNYEWGHKIVRPKGTNYPKGRKAGR